MDILSLFVYEFRSLSLLPTGCEERGVIGVGSIPVAVLPSRLSKYENYCIIFAKTSI